MDQSLIELARRRVVFFDGAMGTSIHQYDLPLSDYEAKEGCSEVLVRTKPDVIFAIHKSFFDAGVDAVETNTFGANGIVFQEYDMVGEVFSINKRAAQIAREAAEQARSKDRPTFVIGSIGPGTRLPTLGHVSFDELYRAYEPQVEGLLAGGVDALLVETCQDILQAKTALICCFETMARLSSRVPVFVQITVETTGTMLLGTETPAAVCALSRFPVAGIGLNCATGPEQMVDHVRTLSQHAVGLISVLPNAGLPEMVEGRPRYPLQPKALADYHETFVREFGVNIVGGCCGTTPAHLEAVVARLHGKSPAKRTPRPLHGATSLFSFVSFKQEPPPLYVGERTNANGSKKFRDYLKNDDVSGMVEMGKEQVQQGAHMLDLCLAYVGREEAKDMDVIAPKFANQVPAPLFIDSTEPSAVEAALKHLGGKCVINSINLEDGGERLAQVCALARRFGAAVVALTIDEEGMAKTADKKVAVARRIYKIASEKYGIPASEIFFDPLTFTLGSGDEEFRRAGMETLEGIKRIKEAIPGCLTIIGLSNISFGLDPQARKMLNSMFLHEAVRVGLDAAIAHAAHIVPLNRIPEEVKQVCLDLIYDRRRDDYDPLKKLMASVSSSRQSVQPEIAEDLPVEEVLKQKIIRGDARDLEAKLDEALRRHKALDIINDFLIAGMQVVGDLFGRGEMQLPFVLQSAEVMKRAVAHLEPHMEKSDQGGKGTIVLATVKGDVHDIGKNLVDIIMTNNGYQVINLGIKQPLENMLQAARDHKAQVIGMSGLLVKSVQVMKENLEELNRKDLLYPVILGGAALNRRYVEHDLRRLYHGKVFYALDAFEGLRLLEALTQGKEIPYTVAEGGPERAERSSVEVQGEPLPPSPVPKLPFHGRKVLADIRMEEVFPFLNKIALYRGQWQFKQGKMKWRDYQRMIEEEVEPIFRRLCRQVVEEQILKPKAIYGFFPCYREGNDLVLLGEAGGEVGRFSFPRQARHPHLCLSDFFVARGNGTDVVALQVVTVGPEATKICRQLYQEGRYREYLFLHGFSVESAEALAEYVHKRVREELGISDKDDPDPAKMIKMKYQGCRYSFGYPACPNLEDQRLLLDLLGAEEIGVTLTETWQLEPEQSTSAIVAHHAAARYFNVE